MAKAGIDIEAELDTLYASPPSEFVSARNALVKTLEAAGRKDDAARVKALKKPNAAAWGVNHLALSAPRVLAALVASGDRLRLGGSDPRESMRKRRDAVHEARREVERAFVGAGLAANPDVLRRVSATLEAIATVRQRRRPSARRTLERRRGSAGIRRGRLARHSRGGAAGPRLPRAAPARREAQKALAERTKEARRASASLRAAEKAVAAIRRKKASLEVALSEAAAEEKALEAKCAEARKASEAAEAAEREARAPGRR